ncbi:MAG: ATP-dependent DNA helicase RecG [Patescibacteria group bacterium]
MYSLSTPLQSVTGIGPALAEKFALKNIFSVKDLLLFLPLRYEDRSQIFTIKQIQENNSPKNSKEFKTVKAKVNSTNNFYRARRSMQSATVQDETGKLKLMWFNNPWIIKKLGKDKKYIFSGKINDKGVMMQPITEEIKGDNIHTGRLVPIYSSLENIKQGVLRKILKQIVDNLDVNQNTPNMQTTLTQLHFPDDKDLVIQARERLALEELLSLIKHSSKIKTEWQKQDNAAAVQTLQCNVSAGIIPDSIPFTLTTTQKKSTQEILSDIQKTTPMNRLLIGDVGSGKTVVAGIACHHIIKSGHSACLIAPTQILAEQHVETFKKLFPELKIKLLTGKTNTDYVGTQDFASLHIGTHALINKLDKIKPALIIYDEQHRFGVSQRSGFVKNEARHGVPLQNRIQPHVLTMSATPIPRSLMLTIFSHLRLSVIDEMPPGRKPVKTWLVPQKKRKDAYQWLLKQLSDKPSPFIGEGLESESSEDAKGEARKLAIIVCPFITESKIPGFEHITSATKTYKEIASKVKALQRNVSVALLHGKLSSKEKERVSKKLFEQKIDILVTTPVIEVGLDLPNADIVVIESAQRFGLASLHQLRGRVGRAGQDSFCMLIPSSPVKTRHNVSQNDIKLSKRLKEFARENNGMKLAEKDLRRRGAGNIFGTDQSGFDQLRFANWANLELIAKARQVFEKIEKKELEWNYFFEFGSQKENKALAAN